MLVSLFAFLVIFQKRISYVRVFVGLCRNPRDEKVTSSLGDTGSFIGRKLLGVSIPMIAGFSAISV
jgi:hypothetical protein